MINLLDEARDLQSDILSLRRRLQTTPEPAFQEAATAETVANALKACGFQLKMGIAETGLLADTGAGKVVAIHTAMDALPASDKQAAFHGCGHDANMACVIGAARIIARRLRGQTSGTLRLIFQPAAELSSHASNAAAYQMIEAGALDNCSAVFGIHVDSTIRSGRAAVVEPVLNSSTHQHFQEIMQQSAVELLGKSQASLVTRTTYGCDFSRYLEKVPGSLVYLGVGIPGKFASHHSPDFSIDETSLYVGAALLANTVLKTLAEK